MKQQSCLSQVVETRRRVGGVVASHQVGARIYYPAFVSCFDERGYCPLSAPHAFEAVYQNAMGFLEKIQADEAFQ